MHGRLGRALSADSVEIKSTSMMLGRITVTVPVTGIVMLTRSVAHRGIDL
jgi:hypothetical protein